MPGGDLEADWKAAISVDWDGTLKPDGARAAVR
jgi:hypothetical protein